MRNLCPKPIFVVGAARSGTSLLFDTLRLSSKLWSAYYEIHGAYEWEIGLEPRVVAGESNFLDARHATTERIARVQRRIHRLVSNGERFGFPSDRFPAVALQLRRMLRVANRVLNQPVTFIDKNPKHCFRIGFLRAIFPDARFIFLARDPRGNIASLYEAWNSPYLKTYAMEGTGAPFARWTCDLPPGWKAWIHEPLARLCAHQWVGYYSSILESAADLPQSSYICVRYERLVANPLIEFTRILEWLDLPLEGALERAVRSPLTSNAITPPDSAKWRGLSDELAEATDIIDPMRRLLGYDTGDGIAQTEDWLACALQQSKC